ncbi:hypothetical protein GCK72_023686 [Caenorhabditis remanei]|uniref:Uncharacterized protein n=1 Tax=Caenorhabditis remanei TaxID=31234 RepID=A0A6A5FXL8_CAERE|nr:hypothetical protein GCK72_023686 [Caenorhabditis remanei]KAF1747224.1 hypothetical protein GCK72_023686 [Caenorhabditis remanei]
MTLRCERQRWCRTEQCTVRELILPRGDADGKDHKYMERQAVGFSGRTMRSKGKEEERPLKRKTDEGQCERDMAHGTTTTSSHTVHSSHINPMYARVCFRGETDKKRRGKEGRN